MTEKELKITILRNSRKYIAQTFGWPYKSQEMKPGKPFYFICTFILTSSLILFIGVFLHLIVSIKNHVDVDLSNDIAQIISYIGILMFITCHLATLRKAVVLYAHLSDVETYGKPPDFDKIDNMLNKFSKWYHYFMTGIVLGVCLTPAMSTSTCERINREKNLTEICGLETAVWLPFDIDYFPVKQIYFGLQVYSSLFTMKTSAYISYFVWEAAQYIKLRFEHVRELFQEAINEPNREVARVKFGKCIDYHNIVIGYAQTFCDCYRGGTLVHVLFSGAVFGLTAYQLVAYGSISNCCLLIGWIIAAGFACVGGQDLLDISLTVGDGVYDTNWYEADIELKKSILLVLARSRTRPINLKAGPISNVNYALMITIFKTAYSYLTLIQRTS